MNLGGIKLIDSLILIFTPTKQFFQSNNNKQRDARKMPETEEGKSIAPSQS